MAKKIEISEQQLYEVTKQFSSRKEMAKYLNISLSCLDTKLKKIGISFNKKVTIPEQDFEKLYKQGLNDSEIGRILGIAPQRIQEYRIKQGLKSNYEKKLVFTEEQYQIFLGGMYGDSYMRIPNDSKNAYFTFRHSLAQEQYCLWKYEKLKNLCFNPIYSSQYDKRIDKIYNGITIRSYCNGLFTPYLEKFYHVDPVTGKKTKYINKELFNTIGPLGLAILFQDDGCKINKTYFLATCSFTIEDSEIIQNLLYYRYNIVSTRLTNGSIYIKRESTRKFQNLIEPYVHDNCKYKLIT